MRVIFEAMSPGTLIFSQTVGVGRSAAARITWGVFRRRRNLDSWAIVLSDCQYYHRVTYAHSHHGICGIDRFGSGQMPTVSFRGGCLTGPARGTELHGFLSYLMICAVKNRPYRVFGYKGNRCATTFTASICEAFVEFTELSGLARVRHRIALALLALVLFCRNPLSELP